MSFEQAYGTPKLSAPQMEVPASSPSTTPTLPSFDYSSYPALQDFLAMGEPSKAAFDEQKKNALIGFGSQELARKYFGNDPFIQSISDNPDTSFSTLAKENRNYRDTGIGTDESLNQQNLYFSGYRGKALGDLAYQHLQNINQGTQGLQNQFAGWDQQYAQALRDWQFQKLQMEQAARDWATQNSLANPGAPQDQNTAPAQWYSGFGPNPAVPPQPPMPPPPKKKPPLPYGFGPGQFGGGLAVGGPVLPGRSYLVGEQGPELFSPGQPGTIIPNQGGGRPLPIRPTRISHHHPQQRVHPAILRAAMSGYGF